MATEDASVESIESMIYKAALKELGLKQHQIHKVDGIISTSNSGKSNEQNLFIIKQKFMLLVGNLKHSSNSLKNTIFHFDLNQFLAQKSTQNLITPICNKLDELLTDLPKGKEMVNDLSKYAQMILKQNILKHPIRASVIQIFKEILDMSEIETKETEQIAEHMEFGAFLYSLIISKEYRSTFDEINWEVDNDRSMCLTKMYHIKVKTLIGSLTNDKYNSELLHELEENPKNGLMLAFRSRKSLLPKYHEFIESARKSEISKFDSDDYKQYESDHQCKRCKKYYVKIVQLQLRSADEPMTTFYVCMYPKCGFREKDSPS
jgi:DNA-directed RNA polymerase subunit M/transcription elongation factor TFIIS